MQRLLVMTVIGEDRPGLVESVAGLVAEHGGNWLESRMSRLGGQFAGILRVEVPSDKQSALVSALKQLDAKGLAVVVNADLPESAAQPARLGALEIVAQDRPGIVRQISGTCAAYNVNVEELSTERSSAAMSGETLFTARAKLSVPETCNTAEFRQELEKIAADLMADLSFEELKQPPAG